MYLTAAVMTKSQVHFLFRDIDGEDAALEKELVARQERPGG
jgi:hypothetical protein